MYIFFHVTITPAVKNYFRPTIRPRDRPDSGRLPIIFFSDLSLMEISVIVQIMKPLTILSD